MAYSMTGFGQATNQTADWDITIQARSVNHRYCDVVVRMPKKFSSLEENIRRLVKEKVSRGRVEIHTTIERISEEERVVRVDIPLAKAFLKSKQELLDFVGSSEDFPPQWVASQPGVLNLDKLEDDLEELWTALHETVVEAIDKMVVMREIEGEALCNDIRTRTDTIDITAQKIKERAPLVVADYKERLIQRISELSEGIELDQSRLLSEVALFADKANIDEELTRLASHLSQVRNLISKPGEMGRKLDFIMQELNREANTIGSKASDYEIAHCVVELKSELEKIREQVQNLE